MADEDKKDTKSTSKTAERTVETAKAKSLNVGENGPVNNLDPRNFETREPNTVAEKISDGDISDTVIHSRATGVGAQAFVGSGLTLPTLDNGKVDARVVPEGFAVDKEGNLLPIDKSVTAEQYKAAEEAWAGYGIDNGKVDQRGVGERDQATTDAIARLGEIDFIPVPSLQISERRGGRAADMLTAEEAAQDQATTDAIARLGEIDFIPVPSLQISERRGGRAADMLTAEEAAQASAYTQIDIDIENPDISTVTINGIEIRDHTKPLSEEQMKDIDAIIMDASKFLENEAGEVTTTGLSEKIQEQAADMLKGKMEEGKPTSEADKADPKKVVEEIKAKTEAAGKVEGTPEAANEAGAKEAAAEAGKGGR